MFFLGDLLNKKSTMPTAQTALKGREAPIPTTEIHAVNGKKFHRPFPDGLEKVQFGMGCFWGAERRFWQMPGVYVTAVGYAGGLTPNPTYQETCTGLTGHAETVLVVYDPEQISFETLLKMFWESHDPTQGMRQGNDVGTTYRSVIYCDTAAQLAAAEASAKTYQAALSKVSNATITTEITPWQTFFYAEGEHQQYLHKNPGGYCGLKGTGVACTI